MGPATIRQLTDVLYPGGGAAQYATIQKLLDRMEAKGYVRRDRSLYVHVFEAVLDRDELIGRRLRCLAETLCDGSLTPLLTHLARTQNLTDEDRLTLRAIIDEAEPDIDSGEIEPWHGLRGELVTRIDRGRLALARPAANEGALPADDDHEHRELSFHGIARTCHVEQRDGRDHPGGGRGGPGPDLPPSRINP